MTALHKLLGIIVISLSAFYYYHYYCNNYGTIAPRVRGGTSVFSGRSVRSSSETTTTTTGGAAIEAEKRLLWRNETPLDDDYYTDTAAGDDEEDSDNNSFNGNGYFFDSSKGSRPAGGTLFEGLNSTNTTNATALSNGTDSSSSIPTTIIIEAVDDETTAAPSSKPSKAPTDPPTARPTIAPTDPPTASPTTVAPTSSPSKPPTTGEPTASPSSGRTTTTAPDSVAADASSANNGNDEDLAVQAALMDETGPVHDRDGNGLRDCLWRVLTGTGCTADFHGDVVQGYQHEHLVADGTCRYNDFLGYYRAGCRRPDPTATNPRSRPKARVILSEAFCTDPNCSTGCQTDAVIRTDRPYISNFCYRSLHYDDGSSGGGGSGTSGGAGGDDDEFFFETAVSPRIENIRYEFSFEFIGGCLETEKCNVVVDDVAASLTRENDEDAAMTAAERAEEAAAAMANNDEVTTMEPTAVVTTQWPTKASKATPSPTRYPSSSPSSIPSSRPTRFSKNSKAYYDY